MERRLNRRQRRKTERMLFLFSYYKMNDSIKNN